MITQNHSNLTRTSYNNLYIIYMNAAYYWQCFCILILSYDTFVLLFPVTISEKVGQNRKKLSRIISRLKLASAPAQSAPRDRATLRDSFF